MLFKNKDAVKILFHHDTLPYGISGYIQVNHKKKGMNKEIIPFVIFRPSSNEVLNIELEPLAVGSVFTAARKAKYEPLALIRTMTAPDKTFDTVELGHPVSVKRITPSNIMEGPSIENGRPQYGKPSDGFFTANVVSRNPPKSILAGFESNAVSNFTFMADFFLPDTVLRPLVTPENLDLLFNLIRDYQLEPLEILSIKPVEEIEEASPVSESQGSVNDQVNNLITAPVANYSHADVPAVVRRRHQMVPTT